MSATVQGIGPTTHDLLIGAGLAKHPLTTGLTIKDSEIDGERATTLFPSLTCLVAVPPPSTQIWSVGFSWDIQDPVPEETLPPNMVVCERPSQEVNKQDVVVLFVVFSVSLLLCIYNVNFSKGLDFLVFSIVTLNK